MIFLIFAQQSDDKESTKDYRLFQPISELAYLAVLTQDTTLLLWEYAQLACNSSSDSSSS